MYKVSLLHFSPQEIKLTPAAVTFLCKDTFLNDSKTESPTY
ncbi:hypothetical protein Runsl_5086 [Runella slithyformis DSM 19594]|uniref:Uncharacterized protein n=1 Tax=Runella slithyformis (strain ATCC 29530 / DSM 19594 / LMG 11500 / NCIMB 11436 / LSU 4) TaxID=761193 RepID=A0A7U4E8M2_RUNSL|nr:hypothetical protein Runsl_5086 [Runella slithyformis DSM 19594]